MAGTQLVRSWAGFQAQIKVTPMPTGCYPSAKLGEVSRSQITRSLINFSKEVKLWGLGRILSREVAALGLLENYSESCVEGILKGGHCKNIRN